MIGAIVRILGKPLLKFVAKPLLNVVKFAGRSLFGGLLGRGMLGRVIGGALGRILGTGLFGGIASILTNTASASGLSEDQLAPQLSQAATKDKIRYYEKQVRNFVPKKGRPKKGEPTNDERLAKLNFDLDQAKKELEIKQSSEKQKSFNRNTIVDSVGTVLGVMSVVPNLMTTAIGNLFGSKEDSEAKEPDLSGFDDEGEEEEVTSESSTIGKNIGGIAGGLLGSVFGGPLLGGTLGYFAGNTLGGLVDRFIDKNKNNENVVDKDEVLKKVEEPKLETPVKLTNPSVITPKPSTFINSSKPETAVSRVVDKPETTEESIKKYEEVRKKAPPTEEELEEKRMRQAVREHLKKVNDPNRDRGTLVIPTKETVIIKNSSIVDKYKTSRG